jgi:acrylyl-CoA reductase (NADPH)
MPQRLEAWSRLKRDLPPEKLDALTVPAKLADLPRLAGEILQGRVRGRVVVETGA